jgi:hypothetical protein
MGYPAVAIETWRRRTWIDGWGVGYEEERLMNQQRYSAYTSLLTELEEWRSANALDDESHRELSDAAEGLLLSRSGDDAEEPLAQASTTVLGMLALDELDEQNASWLLDALLSCGPRIRPAAAVSEAA